MTKTPIACTLTNEDYKTRLAEFRAVSQWLKAVQREKGTVHLIYELALFGWPLEGSSSLFCLFRTEGMSGGSSIDVAEWVKALLALSALSLCGFIGGRRSDDSRHGHAH
jgi:hypothetical protein